MGLSTAAQYGNAGAYFTSAGSSNAQTRFMLGLSGAFIGKRPVSVYSVVRMGTTVQTLTQRIAAPSAAIIGWCGPRPVAFPLVSGWNFDTPLT